MIPGHFVLCSLLYLAHPDLLFLFGIRHRRRLR
jgi:hypothetical protein